MQYDSFSDEEEEEYDNDHLVKSMITIDKYKGYHYEPRLFGTKRNITNFNIKERNMINMIH